MRRSLAPFQNERGAALLWSLITVVVIAMLGVAAYYLSSQDRLISDNFEASYRAVYTADNTLSEYYATFVPSSDLTLPPISSSVVDEDADSAEAEADDGAVSDAADEYDGADLQPRSFSLANATVWVTPTKATESKDGDVYLLEAVAQMTDLRSRPASTRALRTFAQLSGPLRAYAALVAPNGLKSYAPANHLHLDGGKKAKCGAGTHISAVSAPLGSLNITGTSKVHMKPDAAAVDTNSTLTYQELKDSMHVDWPLLSQPSSLVNLTNVITVPGTYATFAAIPFATMNKNSLWPVVHVTGDVVVPTSIKGFGMLIVTGNVTITNKLDWRGVMMVGKAITVTGTGHLHSRGMVATGLGCTVAELANAVGVPPFCKNQFNGEHMGIKYEQCDIEAAWSQLLILRPLTPSRHTTLF
jgi:hypothetical protein